MTVSDSSTSSSTSKTERQERITRIKPLSAAAAAPLSPQHRHLVPPTDPLVELDPKPPHRSSRSQQSGKSSIVLKCEEEIEWFHHVRRLEALEEIKDANTMDTVSSHDRRCSAHILLSEARRFQLRKGSHSARLSLDNALQAQRLGHPLPSSPQKHTLPPGVPARSVVAPFDLTTEDGFKTLAEDVDILMDDTEIKKPRMRDLGMSNHTFRDNYFFVISELASLYLWN